MVSETLILAVGDGDCEVLGDGLLMQPVNAISSLAFAVFGTAIAVWASRATGHERLLRIVFGVAMIATGLGSFAFHGFDNSAAQFSHDITFLCLVLMLAIINVAEVRGWPSGRGWMAIGAVVGAFGITLLVAPGVTNVLTVVVTGTLIASDIVLERNGGIRRRWWTASIVAMVVAVAAFVGGRTGGPLCDPASLLQGHALWHIMSAAALTAYFVATSNARVRRESAR